MTRQLVFAIATSLSANCALAQGAGYFCQFDDDEAAVSCMKAGDPAPAFTYQMPKLDVQAVAAPAQGRRGGTEKKCRLQTESFREQELEGKFNSSLEDLRLKAEDVRAQSERNLPLYRQVILVYHALRDRYEDVLQKYKDANKACRRLTPYETRPDRI